VLNNLIPLHLTVANEDYAVSMHCNVMFVRNNNNSVALPIQPFEQRHDFVTGRGVEVSGGLVGRQNRRIVHQRAALPDFIALAMDREGFFKQRLGIAFGEHFGRCYGHAQIRSERDGHDLHGKVTRWKVMMSSGSASGC